MDPRYGETPRVGPRGGAAPTATRAREQNSEEGGGNGEGRGTEGNSDRVQ